MHRTFLYNQLLKLYAHKRRPDEAYRLFEELRERDLRPTSLTFACLLNACAKVFHTVSSDPADSGILIRLLKDPATARPVIANAPQSWHEGQPRRSSRLRATDCNRLRSTITL